jgi:hypothetical protein
MLSARGADDAPVRRRCGSLGWRPDARQCQPVHLAPASPRDCGLAGQDRHDRPCRPESRRAAFGYGADLDGRGVLPAAVTPGWGRRVDILAPRMSPPSPLSSLTCKIGRGHWSWVGRHGQPNAPGFMSSNAWVRLSAHPCSCPSSSASAIKHRTQNATPQAFQARTQSGLEATMQGSYKTARVARVGLRLTLR